MDVFDDECGVGDKRRERSLTKDDFSRRTEFHYREGPTSDLVTTRFRLVSWSERDRFKLVETPRWTRSLEGM